MYELLETEGFTYAIGLAANAVLHRQIDHLIKRPAGRPPTQPIAYLHHLHYQAGSWNKPRIVVAKGQWHRDELFPRIVFVVTNMRGGAKPVIDFYNLGGTAEQWINEGKIALNWTRLSCHDFDDSQGRRQLFVPAYNLGNFLRRLALPASAKYWILTTCLVKLNKTGAMVVHHARYVTFQMVEVAVAPKVFAAIPARIRRIATI